jgi:lipopolysaccharide export system protein LptA
MACKFRALMPKILAVLTLLALCAPAAQAEKADRYKPLSVEADQPGRIDLANQIVVFNGNVVVTKGTMVIRAARIEVRESPEGYHSAVATGAAGRPATFRQKRDGVDETIEGEAERLEYDGRTEAIRFVNGASVKRLRGAVLADELSGNEIRYDGTTEVFSVAGGAATPANPGGRVRAVLMPRQAAPAEPPASEAPVPLKTTPTLGERK